MPFQKQFPVSPANGDQKLSFSKAKCLGLFTQETDGLCAARDGGMEEALLFFFFFETYKNVSPAIAPPLHGKY